ncbi:MAG TPA: HD domain-containing phosphohydrolase [Candidatus Wunengus sp. YC60]|uniref:HD domain-containing phosphohydrolase n=1 Tax=Candidatus Wunengus sp. YC60 TaxID=3367697 RepID=UPI004029B1C4
MTTNMLTQTVKEDLKIVHDTLNDIRCLAKLYYLLHNPRCTDKLMDESYDSLKELNLKEIGYALTSVLDLERVFPLVNNITVCGTGSLSGMIVLVNGDEVQLKAAKGLPNHVANDAVFKVGDGAIGWVVKGGKSLVIDDIEKDQRFNKQQFKWYLGKTLLCVPIKVRGRVVGVISVNSKKSGDSYTDNDVRFLETIAAYVAIAIRNTDLYERLKNPNKLDHFTSAYYDKNNKYLPVTLRSIKTGAFAGCDLYLQTAVNDEIKYLLYCKGSKLFDDERQESFVKRNINKIHVAKNGNGQYLRYMETNLEHVVRDEMATLHERTHIIYEVAINMMTDALKDSSVGIAVERARDWTTVALDFMLRDKEVYSPLMEMLTYDGNVFRHSVNTAILGLLFGYYLKMPANDLLTLGTGLLLHDIGKAKLDHSMMKKDMEELTKEEKEQMRKHPDLGFILLSNSGNISREACLIAKQHHERYNGKGYPESLKGEEIHYYSRIARILDEFEMRMSKNTINDSKAAFNVLQNMVKGMEGSFDKEILKEFIDFLQVSTCKESVEDHHNVVEFAG